MIHRFLRLPYVPLRHTLISIIALVTTFGSLHAQRGTPFTFLALGDGGEPGGVLKENARNMLALSDRYQSQGLPVSLLIFLGDNMYPNGLNRDEATRRELTNEIIGPHLPLMTKLGRQNVHAIAGNHDYYCTTVNGIPMGNCGAGNGYEQAIEAWSYHYYYPVSLRRAIADGSRDSVEIILFDSAYLISHDQNLWNPLLDSLERMLKRSASAPGVKWRLYMAHHSPYSVGDHAGWRRWISSEQRVGYIGNCISESQDPFRYVQEFFSQQDNCTPRYQAYTDSLMAVIARSGARVQALIAGHDHSLQLLNYPERNCDLCPKIFVVDGASSKSQRVKSPAPPHEYTHPLNNDVDKGNSAAGFLVCTFESQMLALTFIDAKSGEPLDMGGRTKFLIDESGTLLNTK